MARKKPGPRIVDAPDHRICPECRTGTLLDMSDYLFCPAEDPHPGGVLLYGDGRIVRADRNLQWRKHE